MRLKRYYSIRFLKKFEIWGLLQIYMAVSEKELESFQNRHNWHFFCRMLFKHSNGNNAHSFSKGPNFHLSPGKTEGFFKKAWLFLKADTIVKFILEGVPNTAFIQEFSKRKLSEIRFSCEDRWDFFEKKT